MKKKSAGVLDGFLDRGAQIEGTLTFTDTFRIDGVFKGKIVADAELIVGDTATIDAEVRVARLAVSGTLRGVVYATERIDVHAGAKVQAELHTPALSVEDGALIQGPVETGPQLGRPKP